MTDSTALPEISVVVFTYNHEKYLRESLDSILAQKTRFTFEIVIGEDCSTDGTLAICKEYEQRFPDIVRIVTSERNVGASHNVARTLHAARGKYIAMLEGDDYWCDTRKLEMQASVLSHETKVALCYHAQRVTKPDAEGNYREEKWQDQSGYVNKHDATVADLFKFQMKPQTRTVMFRNIFREHPIPQWFYGVRFGDLALAFMLGRHGTYRFIDEEMAVYRVTGKGVSAIFNTKQGALTGDKEWMKIWSFAIAHHEYKYIPEALQGMKFFMSRIRKATGNSLKVRLHLIRYVLFTLKLNRVMRNSLIRSLLKSNFENDR